MLDGREVSARADRTLLQIARDQGIEVPQLCFKEGLDAVGNCRVCMVEIDGERVLSASCCRTPRQGMVVRPTASVADHAKFTAAERVRWAEWVKIGKIPPQ